MEVSSKDLVKKLPVTKILVGAVSFPWILRKQVLKIVLVPVVLMLVVSHLSSLLSSGKATWFLQTSLSILSSLFLAYMAVACHRLFITGYAASSWLRQWSSRDTKFFAAALVVQFSMLGFLTLVAYMTSSFVGATYSPFMSIINMFVVFGVMVFLASRLSLIFPLIAVEDDIDLRRAWGIGRGNTMRLAVIVLVLPVTTTLLLNGLQPEHASIFEMVVMQLMMIGFLVVEIAAVSLSYRELSIKGAGDK